MSNITTFYSDAFGIALKSILEHKLRAFLTLIGIIIGVAAVVVVGASINGLKTYVVDQVSKVLGANHFMVTRMASAGRLSEEDYERMNRRNKDVTWAEYLYLRQQCPNCLFVGAQINGSADLSENGIEMPSVRVLGNTDSMVDIEDKNIETGRYFTADEVTRSASVAVIGADVMDRYFANTSPIGKSLKIRGVPLQIIGVEARRGSFFGDSQDRNIYIPITLAGQIFSRSGGIQIHGKAASKESLTQAIEDIELALRNSRGIIGNQENSFSIVNTEEIGSQVDQFTGAIAGIVVPITMIILVVGGIVVMNIMLVSVTERTFEVGLRKALGATKNQILLQFLIESALLCIAGGMIGLLLAIIVTKLISVFAGMTMTITLTYVVLSVFVSSFIGIIAGLYPAWKAAKLDPIVALSQN